MTISKTCRTTLKFLKYFVVLFAVGSIGVYVVTKKLIFASNFQSPVNKKIYASSLPSLEKKGFVPKDLEKLPIPKDISMDWNAFPADGAFECREDGFWASTASKMIFYGPRLNVFGKNIRMELTLKNVNNGLSVVDFGVYEHGFSHPGPHSLAKLDLTNQKTQKISFDLSANAQFSDVIPRIVIQGKVLFQKLEVYTRYDPLLYLKFSFRGFSTSKIIQNDNLYALGAIATVVEGEITERSMLPSPKQSDYPDCRFSVHFQGNSILAGPACKEELALVLEGFKNYRLLDSANLKAGDKVCCAILPFEDLPDEQKTTQLADDLNLFTLDNYYVLSMCKIPQYRDEKMYPSSGITFADANENYVSIFERHINPPIPQELVKAQQSQIAADLAKMNKFLENWQDEKDELNKKFAAVWEMEKAKDAPGYNRIDNKYVWRNIDNSFWSLPIYYRLIGDIQRISNDKLAAMIGLKDALEANGCQLIVSLVPDLYVIAARVINSDFRAIPDYQTATIVKQLSEAGIESIYASDEIIKNYNRFSYAFFFPANGHPSDTTQDVLSDLIALRLQRYNFPKTLDADELGMEQHRHVYGEEKNYCWPKNCDIGTNTPGSSYKNNCVMYKGKILKDDPQSPVLILGNSFIQTPMESPDSLCTLLGKKMAMGIANYRLGGNAPMITIVQNIFSTPQIFLRDRKVIVLQVGTSYFLTTPRWNNLALMDRSQLLLRGKKLISTINIDCQNLVESARSSKNNKYLKLWDKLEGKHEFCCMKSGENQIIAKLDLSFCESDKDIVCVIPSAVFINDTVDLSIADDLQPIPSYYSTLRWQNVYFRIPAGTKSIELKAQGSKAALFAIKNIMIYQ